MTIGKLILPAKKSSKKDEAENDEIQLQLSYRQPMPVTAAMYFPDCHPPVMFPLCPRCHITMEREYQSYCDRCGQQLAWEQYGRRTRIIIKLGR